MKASKLIVDTYNSSIYTLTTTWIPTESDEGTNLVCYAPVCFAINYNKKTFFKFPFFYRWTILDNKEIRFVSNIML